MTFGEELPGGLGWAKPAISLINCRFGKSFDSDMPGSCRFVTAMRVQVADLVVANCTIALYQSLNLVDNFMPSHTAFSFKII